MSLIVSLQVGEGYFLAGERERLFPPSAPKSLHFQLLSTAIGCSEEELTNISKVFLGQLYYRLEQSDNAVDTFPKAKGLKYRVRLENAMDLLNRLSEVKRKRLEDGLLTFPKREISMTLDELYGLKILTKEDVKACKGCFLGES